MPDGTPFHITDADRNLPPIQDRLIVALDVDDVEAARGIIRELDGVVSFFKIGLWLFFRKGVNDLIDELKKDGKRVFLDYKMFDIGETVRRGVESAVERDIDFVTVHGDPDILREAVKGRSESGLKIFAISVLTSLDDAAIHAMGYRVSVRDLIDLRVKTAVECKCDGIIASASDRPDEIRQLASSSHLLIATPGVRQITDAIDDHKRSATPQEAIFSGADYLVVGRPILRSSDRVREAQEIISEMKAGAERRAQLFPTHLP